MRRIYLDNAATTPVDPRVVEAMQRHFTENFGNASSVHWFGQQSRKDLEGARSVIAASIGATAGEIVFTSGGTEADNFAIRGAFLAGKKHGRRHIVTTAAEHHAVLDCVEAMEAEGAETTVLPVDQYGRTGAEEVGKSLSDRTCLVSVMQANNEVGTISNLPSIAAVVHARGVLLHTDAVQAIGKIPVDVNSLGVDLLTITAHKIYGPKGIGALYIRKGTEIENILWGGGQERGRRPGTENVALAVGFAKAVEIGRAEMEIVSASLRSLRDRLQSELTTAIPELLVNGHPEERLPHILNVSVDAERLPLEGETLQLSLDLEGIAVSSGSACTSGSVQPSHVLLAIGRTPATAKATLRFSFGKSNTEDDIGRVIDALKSAIEKSKKGARRTA